MGDVDDVQMMEYGGGRRNFQNEDEEEIEDRVLEWEDGLPNTDDLTPLSQYMITSELASAFQITPEPYRSMNEVNRASQTTLTSIRKHKEDNNNYKCSSLVNFSEDRRSPEDPVEGVDEDDDDEETEIMMKDGSESRKSRRIENTGAEDAKRPRLVWTPQLHKRFVDVVGHLGIKSAVPKTIMQMMNVEGLTRENVASHLQKYRLYLKRMMQGGLSSTTNEAAPSSSDPLFATTTSPPVPQNNHHELSSSTSNGRRQGNNNNNVPIRSMPMMMVQGHHMGTSTQEYCGNSGPSNYHGFQSHQYNMLREQQREWSGHMFNSMSSSYPYVNPNDK